MQRKIGCLSACGLLVVLAGVTAFAQGVGTSGRIRGTVIDASGALLPNASISIAGPQTGFQRSVVTDSSGQFQTTGLPPASYEVTAQHAGFSSEIRKGIVVGVGQTVTVDFQLKVSQVSVQVEVNSEPPVVETERGSQANSVPERYIMDLPIDRRDYLTFTLLMPGVSNSNTIADNADFRVTAVGNPFVSPGKLASDAFIVNRFETDGGLFPFPIREHQFSARLDHRFSDHDAAFLRYSFAHLDESDPDVQALIGFSRGTSLLNWDSTLQGSWFHQFSPSSTNELRIQWNWYQFNITTNDPGGPGLDVQGYGFFGRGIFLPSLSTIRRYEFADNFSLIRGHHSMRMGFYELLRGNNTTSDTFFPGRFEFLQLPGGLVSPCLQNPTAFCGLPSSVSSAPLSTLQSWSLGLPAFYEQGFGDPRYVMNRPFTAAYWQDSWQIRPNLTLNYGLRYELDSQYGPLSTYKKNFSPRVSFAWDPSGDHKTVIRGGYGIFYSPIYAQIPNVVKTLGNVNGTRQIANTLVSILGLPGNPLANSAVMYQTLFAQGKILCGTPPAGDNACVTAADLAQFGIQVANTGPLPPGTVLFSGQPNYRNPQSQQASLGIERQIGNSLSISANYIYVHTTHLPWAVDQNLLPGAPIVTGTGADGLPTNGLPFQNWGAEQCQRDPGLCFADPTHTILQNNQYSSIANAVYNGGILEVKKRFHDSFSLMANYTYSKAIDDSTDFNSDYSAFNEVDLAAERALSDFDQRHKIVVASLIESPWTKSKILSGFELAPIVSYNLDPAHSPCPSADFEQY